MQQDISENKCTHYFLSVCCCSCLHLLPVHSMTIFHFFYSYYFLILCFFVVLSFVFVSSSGLRKIIIKSKWKTRGERRRIMLNEREPASELYASCAFRVEVSAIHADGSNPRTATWNRKQIRMGWYTTYKAYKSHNRGTLTCCYSRLRPFKCVFLHIIFVLVVFCRCSMCLAAFFLYSLIFVFIILYTNGSTYCAPWNARLARFDCYFATSLIKWWWL